MKFMSSFVSGLVRDPDLVQQVAANLLPGISNVQSAALEDTKTEGAKFKDEEEDQEEKEKEKEKENIAKKSNNGKVQ